MSSLRILISDLSLALSNLLDSGVSGTFLGVAGLGLVAAAMTLMPLTWPAIGCVADLKTGLICKRVPIGYSVRDLKAQISAYLGVQRSR